MDKAAKHLQDVGILEDALESFLSAVEKDGNLKKAASIVKKAHRAFQHSANQFIVEKKNE